MQNGICQADSDSSKCSGARMSRLTERQIAIRDMTREFVRKEVTPFAAHGDRDATVRWGRSAKLARWAVWGVHYGAMGGSGADFTSYALATEERRTAMPAFATCQRQQLLRLQNSRFLARRSRRSVTCAGGERRELG